MSYTYISVKFDTGDSLLQELWHGNLIRYCTVQGLDADPPLGGAVVQGAAKVNFERAAPPTPIQELAEKHGLDPSVVADILASS